MQALFFFVLTCIECHENSSINSSKFAETGKNRLFWLSNGICRSMKLEIGLFETEKDKGLAIKWNCWLSCCCYLYLARDRVFACF